MAKSNLHIICGTCGNNEELKYSVRKLDLSEIGDNSDTQFTVTIYCPNCSTIHSLDDFIEEEKK